jgi:tetratricopeptide (TPR) repeat protein
VGSGGDLWFGEFRLDLASERLWRGRKEVALRAKPFAVLRHLAENPGRLVAKEELFRSVWPGTAVSGTVLRVCIREIRAALGEDALHPRFLTTVERRGYRFASGDGAGCPAAPGLVGRRQEIARLHEFLALARNAGRQVVFVTGEAGIGKTALVERFLDEVRSGRLARVAHARCVELYGAREAYLPIIELLGDLCADTAGKKVREALERFAPSWLLQLPELVDARRFAAAKRRVPNPSRERMLRELAAFVEASTHDEPVVLVLEDLHWSDASTVDALAYLAQRTAPARLLVIGSYRPISLVLNEHPLKAIKQSLHARGLCTDLSLERLADREVQAWLARRLPDVAVEPGCAAEIVRASEGMPLFMVAVTDYLLERGHLAVERGRWRLRGPIEAMVPESLRLLVEQQLDRLDADERRILEVASASGVDFATAPVAATIGLSLDEVETICARLAARGQLVCASGLAKWPDGTVSGRYEFSHSLYREVLYQRVASVERRRLHLALGERLEAAHAGSTWTVAAMLASHFEIGGDARRAVRYHAAAAAAAKARFADREVIAHLEAALTLLPDLEPTTERDRMELGFQLDLGGASLAARGYGAAAVEAAYGRACELAARLGVPEVEIIARGGLYTFHAMRAELRRAREIAESLVATSERIEVPLATVIAHTTLGSVLFNLAELGRARASFERAHAAWRPDLPRLPIDQGVLHLSLLGFTLLHLGRASEAASWIARAEAHAAQLDDPFNVSWSHNLAGQFWSTAGDRELAACHAERAIELAQEHAFGVHLASSTIVRGWAHGDAAAIREGFVAYEEIGQRVATTLLLGLLAETLGTEGRTEEGLETIARALAFAAETGEHRHLAELYRLRGELSRRSSARAEACFREAIAISRAQEARLFELRACVSLGRLLRERGRRAEARRLLADACHGLPEDGENRDLARARALRASL